jgi:aminodeoxyfutalosine deaminase
MRILAARYLLPVSRPPIRDGALLIEGNRLRAVGTRAALKQAHAGVPWRDLGEAILLPGLVNVHTHLELSGLRGQIRPGDAFVDWVLNLLERRRALAWEAYVAGAEEGSAELVRSGTTCVGDVTLTGASLSPLQRRGLRGVIYRELIGPDDARAGELAATPFTHLQAMREEARGTRLEVGISPHAPYSVAPRLFALCRQFQQRLGLKAAIHAAESRAEVEYLTTGTGPIRTRLLPATGWGALAPPPAASSPVAYLERLGALDPTCLLIHAVHLTEEDLDTLVRTGVAVAHCPRSNASLDGGRAPLKALRDRQIPVGLSLWDEIRFAHEAHAGLLTPAEWIAMATVGGARALGLDRDIGTLEPGKRADLTAIILDEPGADPHEYLVHEAHPGRVLLTAVDGTSLYEREAS